MTPTLSSVAGKPLYWVQPRAFDRRFELRAGEDLAVATLRFKSSFGTLATGEANGQSWTFKRVGFLNPRVTVRWAGAEDDLAIYYPRWQGDGTLEFADGRVFRWESINFWGTQWSFFDSSGEPLVTFKPGADKFRLSDLFKTQAFVEISSRGYALAEAPLLALLGWYLMILRNDDTAAVAASAMVVS